MPEVKAGEWWKDQFPKCSLFFPEIECYCAADDERKDELAYGDQCMGMGTMWCPIMEMAGDDERMKAWLCFHIQKTNPKVAEEIEETVRLKIQAEYPEPRALAL